MMTKTTTAKDKLATEISLNSFNSASSVDVDVDVDGGCGDGCSDGCGDGCREG